MKRTIRLLVLTAVAAATLAIGTAAGAQDGDVVLIDPPIPADAPVADGEVHIGEGIRVERSEVANDPAPEAEPPTASPIQSGPSGADTSDGVEASVPHPPAAPSLDPIAPAVTSAPAATPPPTVFLGPAKAGRSREVALDAAPLVSHRTAPWRGLPLVIVLAIGAAALVTTEVARRRSMRLARA